MALRAARAFRLLILPAELTGEQTASKRAPDQQTHPFSFEKWNEFAFEVATGYGVVGLESIETREVLELGDAKGLGDLPRLPIGDADVADLALVFFGNSNTRSCWSPKYAKFPGKIGFFIIVL
jgi:hypothetical protein